MAQIHSVRFVDDLDGGVASETVAFAVDGNRFEIDLSADNAAKLRAELATYVVAARRTSGRRSVRHSPAVGGPDVRRHNQAVRAWAREHGYDVSVRGRISAEIQAAYEAKAGSSSVSGSVQVSD